MSRCNPLSAITVVAVAISMAALPTDAQPSDQEKDTWEISPAAATDTTEPAVAKAAPDTVPEATDHFNFPKRLLPSAILAGPQAGVQASRLRATSEYGQLIEPTPGRGAWTSPSWGAVLALRWRSGFSLTASPRRETYGLATREETVSFSGNPFPHTLSSRTELSYNLWPLLAGIAWSTPRQRLQAQAGAYIAYLVDAKVEWTVDGDPYANHPYARFTEDFSGWMVSIDYGYRVGKGELIFGLETHRASKSVATGLEGSLRPETAQARVAYLWTLMER